LTAEVVLSALILGPLVTTVSLSQYFSDEKLYLYFYNVLGNIHLELPGVFASLPYPNITNGSLWTVPFELMSYVILIGLALTSIARSWRLTLGVFVLGSGYLAYALIVRAEFVIPRVLVLDFFAGVCLFLMRDFVPLRLVFFVVSLIVLFSIMKIPALLPISPMFVAYVTVYIGLLNIPNNPVLRSGDYSYGIYLYAFPIQQTLVYAFPMFENRWYYHALASFVVVLIFAVFSWHCIERPAMGLKRFLKDGRLDKRDAMLLHLATERPERQGKK
jgi:peptidoglycan/LPS O-acetylase OafA/YrhL